MDVVPQYELGEIDGRDRVVGYKVKLGITWSEKEFFGQAMGVNTPNQPRPERTTM